jgi:hypothetical protein
MVGTPANKACTGRLGLGAFNWLCSELCGNSVFEPFSRQPPVTLTVRRSHQLDCHIMKSSAYVQQFKTNLVYGIRIVAFPTMFISITLLLYLSPGFDVAMWDVEFFVAMLISLFYIVPFLFNSFLGLIVISLVISSRRKLPNIAVFGLGALIGVLILAIGNIISSLFGFASDEFSTLSSISTVFLLAYVGQKMNRHANLDTSLLELELRGGLWMALIAFVGAFAFALIKYKNNIYWGSLYLYSSLGKGLSIALPIAVSVGFMIGFIIKKTQKPA